MSGSLVPELHLSLAPEGALGQLVDKIWLYRAPIASAPLDAAGRELRLPTGAVELVVDLGESAARPEATIIGPSRRPFLLDRAAQTHVLGVVFRPGAARPLLGVSLDELRDHQLRLADLWGAAGDELGDRLANVPDGVPRLREAEAVLHERLMRSGEGAHPLAAAASAWLSRAPAVLSIAGLSDRMGWTVRRIEQVFRLEVGLTPKAYHRLQRFRSALVRIDRVGNVGWAAFALESGYADQSHFIREFRAHMELSPSDYLRRRGTQLNHIPVDAE